ncbi:MAG: hypothetical protein H6974_07145 [Gammaproteobacteria bacterium]|nr:hypothetical protein [Gammaproteobacteria bacterium]MCP5196547.1 hypothetical protein [Gammaproteobacteria bacterium]
MMEQKLTQEWVHAFMGARHPQAYFQECSGVWIIPGSARAMSSHEIEAAAAAEVEQYEQGFASRPSWYPTRDA